MQLATYEAPAEWRGLIQQRDGLLKKIARSQRELDRFEAELREIGGPLAVRAQPLVDEARRLDAMLHRMFAELRADRRWSRRQRREIEQIFAGLQVQGVLGEQPLEPHTGSIPPDAGEPQPDD